MRFRLLFLFFIVCASPVGAVDYYNKIKALPYESVVYKVDAEGLNVYKARYGLRESAGVRIESWEGLFKSGQKLKADTEHNFNSLYLISRDGFTSPNLLEQLKLSFSNHDSVEFWQVLNAIAPEEHTTGYFRIEHGAGEAYLKISELINTRAEINLKEQKIKILKSIVLYHLKQLVEKDFGLEDGNQDRLDLDKASYLFFCSGSKCRFESMGNLGELMTNVAKITQVEDQPFAENTAGVRTYFRKHLCLMEAVFKACRNLLHSNIRRLIVEEQSRSKNFTCQDLDSYLSPLN